MEEEEEEEGAHFVVGKNKGKTAITALALVLSGEFCDGDDGDDAGVRRGVVRYICNYRNPSLPLPPPNFNLCLPACHTYFLSLENSPRGSSNGAS